MLDAPVELVARVDAPVRSDRDPARRRELVRRDEQPLAAPDRGDVAAVGRELLDPMVAGVRDVDGTAGVDRDLARHGELAVAGAAVGEGGHEATGPGPHRDASPARGLDDVEISVRPHGDAFRRLDLVDLLHGTRRRPDRPDEAAGGRELLDPPLRVGRVDVAVPVGRDAADRLELTVSRAARPPLAEEVRRRSERRCEQAARREPAPSVRQARRNVRLPRSAGCRSARATADVRRRCRRRG